MVTTNRLLLGLLLVAALALTAAGCPCNNGRPVLAYDGFDSTCTGSPCGWQVEAGQVASVATLHPGERGLHLASGAVLSLEVAGRDLGSSEEAVEALLRCDAGTTVRFSLALTHEGASDTIISATADAPAADARLFTRFEGPLLDDAGAEASGGTPERVRLELVGPGTCDVDELFFYRGPTAFCDG